MSNLIGKMQVPSKVSANEVFQVQILLKHEMDTGFIRDANGQRIAQNLIKYLHFYLDETPLMRLTPSSGMAANPYLQLSLSIPKSGKLICRWEDERGAKGELTQDIALS